MLGYENSIEKTSRCRSRNCFDTWVVKVAFVTIFDLDFGFANLLGSVITFALANEYRLLGLGRLPERPKGADCKSAGTAYGGSNPSPATNSPVTKVAGLLCI